jgi:hypothetical protein
MTDAATPTPAVPTATTTVLADSAPTLIELPTLFFPLIALAVGLTGFLTKQPVFGFVGLGATVVIAAIMYVLWASDSRSFQRRFEAQEAQYTAWQSWLKDTYGLQLTPEQNDELVNGRSGQATMTKAMVWGDTTIIRDAVPITIRLAGDASTNEYFLVRIRDADNEPIPLARLTA